MKTRDKIKELKASLADRETIIVKKEKENEQLREDLEHAEREVEEVLNEKNQKLGKILENLLYVDSAEFSAFLVTEEFTDSEQNLLDALAEVE